MTAEERKARMEDIRNYKEQLIASILSFQTHGQFTREDLEGKTTRVLEIIHDNVD